MAHIRYVEYNEASPELRAAYDKYRGPDGKVDNILRIHGLNPPSMDLHYQLYALLTRGPSDLSRVPREMIAVAT